MKISEFKNIKKEEILPIIYSFFVGIIFIIILSIVSLILFPLARIPKGHKQKYKALAIGLKAIPMNCLYRDFIEGLLGYQIVFFSNKDMNTPYFLYIKTKEMEKLPHEFWKFTSPNKASKITKHLILDVETRKSLLCGYLPAKILAYDVVDGSIDWSK